MENFNATTARSIVDSNSLDKLHNILVDIKNKACNGETVLHIYEFIHVNTISKLKDLGFKITTHPGIDIQRDNLYYSIYW